MVAAKEGHIEVAKLLIKAGADINIKSTDGKTTLDHARDNGNQDIVQLLLEAGAVE